ncbi:MAG: MmcQ/YjbR family DNA-binding protein [bacterium]
MGRRTARGLSWDTVCALGEAFPGTERSTSYGTPALKVKGKLLARLKEDGESMVLRMSFVVRDHLMMTEPATFYITDHYRDYPSVLVRLEKADHAVIGQLLEDAWRDAAPKTLVKSFDDSARKER